MSTAVEPSQACREWVAARLGAPPERFDAIAPGLGHRNFYRVTTAGGRTLILRSDPPESRRTVGGIAPEPALEPIRALLERAGLPVPTSHGHDEERGWDLLEDVGDLTLEKAAAEADTAGLRQLYGDACGLLGPLQRVGSPGRSQGPEPEAFSRVLDAALIATKAKKVIEWLLPECLGRAASSAERSVVETAFARVAALAEAAPRRLSHRDYKAANIHLVPGAEGEAPRLALIDLQGAFLAPPEYDLVCLLRDSHVPLPVALVDDLFERTRAELPDAVDPQTAAQRFDALTLTRVGKDLAHYLDAAMTRGDDRYLGFVATGLENLSRAAERLAASESSFADAAELFCGLGVPARCTDVSKGGEACAR